MKIKSQCGYALARRCLCLPSTARAPAAQRIYRSDRPDSSVSARANPRVQSINSGPASNRLARQKDAPRRNATSVAANTSIDAPAHLVRGMWTVDQIPPERLIAPLAVLDVTGPVRPIPITKSRSKTSPSGSRFMGRFQPRRGAGPHGWGARWTSIQDYRNTDKKGVMHFPGYSEIRQVSGRGPGACWRWDRYVERRSGIL